MAQEYDREICTIDIGGMVHVYMDEESVASLEELMDFAAAHPDLFYAFRARWGRTLTRAMQ